MTLVVLLFFANSLMGCRSKTELVLVSSGQSTKKIEVGNAKVFSLQYIHSVEKTPVIENFRIEDDGTFILTSTSYQSYGVGLPSLPGEGKFNMVDGWIVLENLHRVYPDIRLRVGPEARLSIEANKKKYPIFQWYNPGSLVIIKQDFEK